jgi:hypothetical protein
LNPPGGVLFRSHVKEKSFGPTPSALGMRSRVAGS